MARSPLLHSLPCSQFRDTNLTFFAPLAALRETYNQLSNSIFGSRIRQALGVLRQSRRVSHGLTFTIFHWPGEHFKLPAFQNAIKKAYLLSDPATPLTVTTDTNGSRGVGLGHSALNVMATVVVVEIEGDTAVLNTAH